MPEQQPETTFHKNLRQLIGDQSVNAWAKKHKLEQTTIQRLMAGSEPKLSMIERIASSLGVFSWELLVPDFSLEHRPHLASASPAEKSFYEKLKQTREAIDGVLQTEGNTTPGDLPL